MNQNLVDDKTDHVISALMIVGFSAWTIWAVCHEWLTARY